MKINKTMKRLTAGVCAAIASVFILAITSGGPALAQEKVRIAGLTWPGYGYWFIIKEKNLAPNLEIDYQAIEDPAQRFNMLATGQLDVVSSTIEFTPIAIERGMPVRVVAYQNLSYGTDKIVVAPDVDKPEDLIGKKVAILEGGLTQIYMGIWLEQNGLSIKDVNMVNVIMDDAAAAMIGGDVAAAEFWEPYGSNVLKALPGSRVVADSQDPFWLKNALLADAIFMGADFISDKRDAAVELMRAYYDAVKWYKENPTEGNQIIADGMKMEIPDVEMVLGKDGTTLDGGLYSYDFIEAARFCGVAPGDPPFDQTNGQFYAHWKLTNEWWLKFGTMSERIPPVRGIDCSLLRELYETGYAGEPAPNY